MSDATTKQAKAAALDILGVLVKSLGQDAVTALIDMVTGTSTVAVIDDLSTLGMQVMQAVDGVLEPAEMRAALQASYAVADAQADALETAKFGPKP